MNPFCPIGANCTLSGAGLDFLTGGLRICGLCCGLRDWDGGNTGVSDISWLDTGRMPSCFEGAGIGSGKTCAGICDGDGAMWRGAIAGDDMCTDTGAGELCLTGEKDGRFAEAGGKDECGLLKL